MPPTILVVEDDAAAAESIQEVLVRAGYDVPEVVASGAAAIDAAGRLRPQLVLMDIELEGPLDGIDTAAKIRELNGIRALYLTAFSEDATVQRAKLTTPLGYLKKPFNPRELRLAVEIALQQVALESALATRERWFATTLQSIGDAVLTTDGDDRITFLNKAAKTIVNVHASEALGKKVDEVVRLVDGRGAPLPLPLRPPATTPGAVAVLPRDARLVNAALTGDGPRAQSVEIEGSIAPIGLEAGTAQGTVMVFRDVRERRRLERHLGMSERLAAVGTMASGMQHEINNPLASIVANVQFTLHVLRENPGGPSRETVAELIKALDDACAGAERVRCTVADLSHFSRNPDVIDSPIALTAALDEAVKMTAHTVRHHATVRREYGRSPRVRAEEGQLARVFMNLLLHAAQATGDGGAAQHTIVLKTRTDASGRAVAEVTHDGPGIAPDVLHRIFDPFFTTAPQNGAMGLALAVCHNIVTSLGGEIDVESELGSGTTFRVSLPAAQPTSPKPARPAATVPPGSRSASPTGRARVLIVDDEIAIGKALQRILSREHEVTLESDARLALERLTAGSPQSYDVVFCDLMMPNMSGMDFFDALSSRAPELAARVVFLTGGAFSPRSEEFLRDNQNVCIAKPFSRETIISVIRRMMETA